MKKRERKRGTVRRARYARRNMDVTAALLRCALACSAFIVVGGALSVSGAYAKMPAWLTLIVQAALTALCFGLPAWRGLFAVDGSQVDKLHHRALTAGQLMHLCAAGALLVCPMTLMNDLLCAPFVRMGLVSAAEQAPPAALFLPMLVKSAVIVPLCEELFFRGYLLAALREAGVRGAMVFSAVFFALVHGVDAMLLPRLLLGLLLGLMMVRTDSILAAILLHAMYNLTLLLLSFAGLGGLFSSLGFVSCLLRLLGCAAFVAALKTAYCAPRASELLKKGRALTLAQSMLFSFALAALVYIPIVIAALEAAGGKP